MPHGHAITSLVGFQSHRVVRWKRHHKSWVELWLRFCGENLRCATCGGRLRRRRSWKWRRLRDLKISKHRVYVWVDFHSGDCNRCGVRQAYSSVARLGAHCTRRYERWLFIETGSKTVKALALQEALDWVTIKNIEIRYIRGLLRKRNLDGITELGIDEVSEKKGHRYLTLVTDLNKRRVIWVGRGRDRAVIRKFFHWFGKKRTRRLKIVVIDMHDPYLFELRKSCRAKIIFDRFHVVKPLHLAIDNIRRRLYKELPPEGRRYIKNSRFLLLRHRADLSPKQSVRLKDLLAVNEPLNVAYILKEDLWSIFEIRDPRQARTEFRAWKRRARESKIPEVLDYVKMLDRRRFGIMNFFKYRRTNGLSEGMNNVVKTIKKMAYGFHDWQYFRLKILRQCGKLGKASVDRD